MKIKVEQATTFDKRAYELEASDCNANKSKNSTAFGQRWTRSSGNRSNRKQGVNSLGGEPPSSLYKWVKTRPEAVRQDAAPVVPDCWTDDTGGGQATCMRRLLNPSTMVDKDVNSVLR